jgi:hypothetical protein
VRELINHGADVNAEDAVSYYQTFLLYVKVITMLSFLQRNMFLLQFDFYAMFKHNHVAFVSMLSQVDSNHQDKPETGMSHLTAVQPVFPGPSYLRILKRSRKAVTINHLLVLDYFWLGKLSDRCLHIQTLL